MAAKIILLVDNDSVATKRLKTELEERGFVVDYITNSKDVFKKLVTARPNIVILEAELADLSGWQICKLLKNNPGAKNIPIIIVSEDGSIQTQLQAIEKGANGFLKKPYSLDELIAQLDRIIHD